MSSEESWLDVPLLLTELSEGQRSHVEKLWQCYFDRLAEIAEKKMPPQLRRVCDGEDVALSALNSFISGAEQRRYPDLKDPADLWSLLVVISKRKLFYRMRAARRLKRGGGKVRGESVFLAPGDMEPAQSIGLENFFQDAPSAEDITEMGERIEQMLSQLGSEEFRQVVELKLQGYTHDEIAERLNISVRTVHRRLLMIRQVWSDIADQDNLET